MRKATLTTIAARVAATVAVVLALGAVAGTAAPSAAAATCGPASGQLDGVHYCHLASGQSGDFAWDVYETYVFMGGVTGTLIRYVRWNGYGYRLYGVLQDQPRVQQLDNLSLLIHATPPTN